MDRKTAALVLFTVSSAVLAAYMKNWIWLAVAVLCAVLAMSPRMVTGNSDASYNGRIVIVTTIPFLTFLPLSAAFLIDRFEYYEYAVLALQALASMMCGYMLFVTLHEKSELRLSKKWVLVFSMLFACAVTVLYMFALFFAMVDAGYPMYNEDFMGPGAPTNDEPNKILMMSSIIAVFLTIAYAVVIRAYLRNVTDDEACFYAGGRE
jgi:hypothetical protein